jgi:hypothetical protein
LSIAPEAARHIPRSFSAGDGYDRPAPTRWRTDVKSLRAATRLSCRNASNRPMKAEQREGPLRASEIRPLSACRAPRTPVVPQGSTGSRP